MDDEPLGAEQAGALAGIAANTWRAYVARGQAPAPDGTVGARTPYWWRTTVERWQANRPGQGKRKT